MTSKPLSSQYQRILAQSQQKPVLASAKPPAPIRCLGVLLCYNDADILADVIEHLLINRHDLVVWDHGSTDNTQEVLARYKSHIVEHRLVPRSVDFYGLYQAMSQNLMDRWVQHYDWISWPDQDEILEGPDRAMSYYKHIERTLAQGHDWVVFNNVNYWWTEQDIPAIASPIRRVRHYAIFLDCAPRVRAWRASKTNIRMFNHNTLEGVQSPRAFNLRHYPMRSEEQMRRRILSDRKGLQRGNMNYHYNHMAQALENLTVAPEQLYFDDGVADLQLQPLFNWRTIYGGAGAKF